MKTFYVPKRLVDSGQVPLESLRAWSIYKKARVVIPEYATIIHGEIKYVAVH
jgi:hypothetical protein